MRIPIVLGAAAALLAHTATATAAPAWCKGGKEKPSYDMKTLFTETDPWDALENLIGATCYADADIASYAKQIEATRVAWSKKLGLTDADWVDVNEFIHYPRMYRGSGAFSSKNKGGFTTYSALDQWTMLDDSPNAIEPAYIADALGAKLTATGRISYVRTCISRSNQDDAPVWFAMCAADVAAIDLTKAYAEIAADTSYELYERMNTRLMAYEAVQKLPQLRTDMQAMRAKDPAYDKMFELAQAAQKQWAGVDAKAVALMTDLDDAHVSGSRKASQGCMERAETAWADAVRAVPAKKYGEINGEAGNTFIQQMIPLVTASPTGYLTGLALNVCANLEKKDDGLTRAIGAAFVRWPGFRGPRTGTQTAILTAGLQLDQRDAEIKYPTLGREFIDGDANLGFIKTAAIAKVTVQGETATITFAKQKVRQTRCVKGHYTNRVQRITDNGQFLYEYQCDKYIDETIEVEPNDPQKVPAKYAKGLVPGMAVTVTSDVVSAAYPAKSATPSFVTGVAVK